MAQKDDFFFEANNVEDITEDDYQRAMPYVEAAQAIGTMYFIPREKTEMAEALFTAIDNITLNYTEVHPEQMFVYQYRVKEYVMQFAESNNISELFEGHTGKGHVSTRVLFGITPNGYYVAIADVENNFCIPKEWHVLKSFVNGKKVYVKGMEPKKDNK